MDVADGYNDATGTYVWKTRSTATSGSGPASSRYSSRACLHHRRRSSRRLSHQTANSLDPRDVWWNSGACGKAEGAGQRRVQERRVRTRNPVYEKAVAACPDVPVSNLHTLDVLATKVLGRFTSRIYLLHR
jgi:hypothetical protein